MNCSKLHCRSSEGAGTFQMPKVASKNHANTMLEKPTNHNGRIRLKSRLQVKINQPQGLNLYGSLCFLNDSVDAACCANLGLLWMPLKSMLQVKTDQTPWLKLPGGSFVASLLRFGASSGWTNNNLRGGPSTEIPPIKGFGGFVD